MAYVIVGALALTALESVGASNHGFWQLKMNIALDGARTRATESEWYRNAWQVLPDQVLPEGDICSQIGDFTFKTATFLKGLN